MERAEIEISLVISTETLLSFIFSGVIYAHLVKLKHINLILINLNKNVNFYEENLKSTKINFQKTSKFSEATKIMFTDKLKGKKYENQIHVFIINVKYKKCD